jgi:hypothetical protein
MTAKFKRMISFGIALAACFSICAFLCVCRPACAQKGPPSGLDKAAVLQILRSGTIGDQKQQFEDYFKKSFFPQFESSAGSFDKFFKLRSQLRVFLVTGKSGAAHDELNRMVLEKMTAILRKGEPAAKINALLVIGELNENDEPLKVKPLSESFALLWKIVQAPKVKDELKQPAMIGIERFAAASAIPPATKDAVSKWMLDLVKQSTPPANRSPEVHSWMRRSAGQVLAKLGSPGPNNSVLNAFTAIADDPKVRPTLRCEMVQLVGQLKYPTGAKVDLKSLANSMAYDMIEVCNQELDAAKTAKTVRNPRLKLIMYALCSARDGLAGLQSAAADTPHKKFVSDAYSKFKSLHAELDDPDLKESSVADEVSQKLKDLQTVLGPRAAAKDEVATADRKEKLAEPVKK